MFRAVLTSALILCASIQICPAADLPSKSEVIQRFVEAVGGRDALERIEARHFRGTIVEDLTWKDPRRSETPFVAEADSSGRVLYAETSDWTELPTVDSGEPRRDLRWLMHPQFALVLEEFYPELKVSGRERRAGRNVIVLLPRGLPREHYALYFDEVTGLLNHVGYHKDLRDWTQTDGILLPRSLVCGRKGGHTTYLFQTVGLGRTPGTE